MKIQQLILSLLLSASALCCAAQTPTAADIFAAAPQTIFPLLDHTTRLEMIEYFKAAPSTPSKNIFDGSSTITDMTPQSLTVKLTDSSQAQIALLPDGNDTIIILITTLATPGLDSTVAFYTTDWQPLPATKYHKPPTLNDWLVSSSDEGLVNAIVPFMLASAQFDPAAATLTYTCRLADYLGNDTFSTISSSLHPTITYTWTGKKFTK